MKRRYLLLGLLVLFVPFLVAACGGGDDDEEVAPPVGEETAPADTGGAAPAPAPPAPAAGGEVSGELAVMAVWTGAEQEAFQAVLDGFTAANPDVSVNYTPAGDQLPTQLSTAVELSCRSRA
jgi:alpha-glucoside transport system substrate-binding protein